MTTAIDSCQHCGGWHTGVCPRVKSLEYDECGRIRRVEYHPTYPPPADPAPATNWPIIYELPNGLRLDG